MPIQHEGKRVLFEIFPSSPKEGRVETHFWPVMTCFYSQTKIPVVTLALLILSLEKKVHSSRYERCAVSHGHSPSPLKIPQVYGGPRPLSVLPFGLVIVL